MERYFNYARDYTNDGSLAGGSTVTVYNAGTLTLASIYADVGGTPKSNPFTADSSAYFYFYCPAGRYDVTFSGSGITSPFTWSDLLLIEDYNLIESDAANTFIGDQTFAGNILLTGSLTASGNEIISDAGQIPGINSTYFASLDGSAIINLNATQILNGTLPSARLSGTYSSILSFTNPYNTFVGSSISLGSTPAASGAIRLTYNEGIHSKNSGGADVLLMRMGTTGYCEMGEPLLVNSIMPSAHDTYNLGGTGSYFHNTYHTNAYIGSAIFGLSAVATTGAIRLGNGSAYAVSFLDNGANTKSLYVNTSSQFVLELPLLLTGDLLPSADNTHDLGSAAARWNQGWIYEFTSGTVIIKHATAPKLQMYNNAGDTLHDVLSRDSSDRIVIGNTADIIRIAYPLSGTTGSAAASIGNLPSGAATTFLGWWKIADAAGNTGYVPVWS